MKWLEDLIVRKRYGQRLGSAEGIAERQTASKGATMETPVEIAPEQTEGDKVEGDKIEGDKIEQPQETEESDE